MTEIKSATLKCAPANIDVICINGKLSIEGQGHLPHELCQGTGYRFPTLWTECPHGSGICHDRGFKTEQPCPIDSEYHCYPCHGTGWIPSVTEGKLLEILMRRTGEVLVGVIGMGPDLREGRQGYYVVEGDDPPVITKAETLLEALDAAIMATVFSPQ